MSKTEAVAGSERIQNDPKGYPESKIQNIVFDLGGVLIDWNPRYLYRQLEADEEKIEWFLANICHSEWNEQQDAGRTFEEATQDRLAHFPEHEEWIRAYYDRWQDMLGGPIEGTVEILSELKENGRSLYALTNWSAESFPVAKEMYPFLNWFDGIVVSGELKLIKPDPRIYHHLLDVHDIRAEESVFIDDRFANVEGARNVGFYGIHFQSPEQLREELEELGFL